MVNIVAIDLSLTSTGLTLFRNGKVEGSEIHLICGRKAREGEHNVHPLIYSADAYLKAHKKHNKTAQEEIQNRYFELRNTIIGIIRGLGRKYAVGMKSGVDLVVFEGMSFGSRGNALFDLGKATGIVQAGIIEARILEGPILKFDVIPPTTVKKLISGKGTAPKSIVAMKVFQRTGIDLSAYGKEAEDLYDSIAVGLTWYKLQEKK